MKDASDGIIRLAQAQERKNELAQEAMMMQFFNRNADSPAAIRFHRMQEKNILR